MEDTILWLFFTRIVAVPILALAEGLEIGTIEKIMGKSDLELGIESLKKHF